jgi:glutaredoxin-related protein
LGTPKETGSNYEKMWDLSDKRYYFLNCTVCHKEFTISELDDLVSDFKVKCPHCQNVEDKRDLMPRGRWIATDPGKRNIGFHLSQTYVPTATKEYIMHKIDDEAQKGTDTIRYTKNEILGQFYSGLKIKPSLENINKSFDKNLPYNVFIPVTRKVYMGIDWGGWSSVTNDPTQCYTVASIGAWNDEGKLFVNYVEILNTPDEMQQVQRISQLMRLYRVNRAVADSGYGKTKNYQLTKEFGPQRFITCKYLQGSAATIFDFKSEGIIHVNRDYALEELYADMGYGKLAIPDNEQTEWIKQHFLNFEVENIVHGGQVFKHYAAVKKENAKTDAVHSINYMRIAALLDEKREGIGSPLSSQANQRAPLPMLAGPGGEFFSPGQKNIRDILIPQNRNIR